MEQRRMHPQQLNHNAHDAASYDISQSPFYTSFPGLELQGDPKVTEAPHLSPSYVQQQYAHHDSGASLEAGGSPPLSFRIQEQPQQGHPRLAPPPALQYHQPCPTGSYAFTHDHEGHNPTPQGLSHQFPRAPPQPAHLSIDTWAPGPFSEDPTALRPAPRRIPPIYGPTYAVRPQPMYPLSTIHPPTPTHVPPKQSQPTTAPAPTTLPEQHEDRGSIDHGQRSRSWGAGALDVTTGVFVRAPDHPRIRTAQACEKCRLRKAKCSGEHPSCQRCLERKLDCKYAAERRMRGPNKPKPPLLPLPDGSPPPPAAEGQRTRRRASTMPSASASRRGLQVWGQQQQQQQQRRLSQQQERGVVAAASPASSASSAGSGSRGFPPLSESEASPMTPHSLLDSRPSSGPSFPASPRVFIQHYSANMRSGMLGHVSEGNGYADDGMGGTEGMVAGVYGQDIFSDSRRSFESKSPF